MRFHHYSGNQQMAQMQVQSWLGHAGHADTYNLRCKMFNGFVMTLSHGG
jgi:hypothetical protein